MRHRKLLDRSLDRSLEWIRKNLHATNLDVPPDFVAEWIFEDDSDREPRPPGFFFSVFTFGYMQYQLLTGPLPAHVPRSIPVSRLVAHFDRWQMKLALAEIHYRTEIQVDPMPLFEFPEGEEIKYRPRAESESRNDGRASDASA